MTLGTAGELQIANAAPQLVASDIPRLGERFFRIDTGDGGSHAGLGLAIASAITRVLGIGFRLELDAGGDLVASLEGFRTLDGLADSAPGAP